MQLPSALRRLPTLALLLATACSTGQVVTGADAAPGSDAALDDLDKKPWDDREPLPDDTGLGAATMCGDGRTDPDRCGDGTVDATEECDPMGPPLRCETPAYRDAPARCSVDCRVDRTMCVRAARCGNGVTEPGESCDDGNTVRCDGCSEVCLAEPAGLCGPPPDPPPRPPVITAPATGYILDARAACRDPATLAATQADPELTVPYALHVCQRRGALVRPLEEVESVMDRVRAVLRVSSRLALVPTDVRYFEHPSCQFATSNEAIRAQIVQATTPGVIPIAVVDELTHDATARAVAGYAITGRVVFASEIDTDTGVAAMPRALDEQTLVHELGHFLGLADTLVGSAGDDVLFSGPTGRDTLIGNGGDDALLSESPAMDPMTRGERYEGGGDRLDGGPGNDQLVSDYPCGAHTFIGGPGNDIAGFRRSTGTRRPFFGISAQLGGPAATRQAFHGRAFNPERCALDPWGTRIAGDLEILEGADGDDRLFGNDERNTIWAWGGDDVIQGYGGNDELAGHDGNDEIYGGEGRDTLMGNDGFDRIHARDGEADARIDCGPGGGRVETSDPSDPAPTRCN
ncbi:MAG: DUF4215 domain-containing protein [Deltaproteobacteria bacterium]|nr:DUF4215 domain-containing protein [Myxococcales bacterium]MDP3214318.1 DUF4215 domain-containing protein [Deltaproteobacteria bacterium]